MRLCAATEIGEDLNEKSRQLRIIQADMSRKTYNPLLVPALNPDKSAATTVLRRKISVGLWPPCRLAVGAGERPSLRFIFLFLKLICCGQTPVSTRSQVSEGKKIKDESSKNGKG